MNRDAQTGLPDLIEKDRIRKLVLLYSRAIDRRDHALLRTLYTADATDSHGDTFDGAAADYCAFIERSSPFMRYSGHHVCNHMIALRGDEADGEAYAIAVHVVPDGEGDWVEDVRFVRYIDNYRKEADGRWRFAKRLVTYDHRRVAPVAAPPADPGDGGDDPSYGALAHALFGRGPRS